MPAYGQYAHYGDTARLSPGPFSVAKEAVSAERVTPLSMALQVLALCPE